MRVNELDDLCSLFTLKQSRLPSWLFLFEKVLNSFVQN
nr:MAG TPA: hypothetical protein [Caudoviricetes sp.]